VHAKHEFKVKEPLNPYPDESLEVSGEFLGPIVFWLSFTCVCDLESTFFEPGEENIARQGEKFSKIYLLLFIPLIGHG